MSQDLKPSELGEFDIQGASAADTTPSLIILSELEGFRAFATELASQSRKQLRIYSQQLNPLIFAEEAFVSACSACARNNPRAKIEILVSLPQALIEQPHPLVRLQQRLSDKIKLRALPRDFDPENIHKLEREYLLGDDDKILLQHDSAQLDGFVNFDDRPNNRDFQKKFDYLWGHGEAIGPLQRLGI
ncbi:hypothetical protein L1F30_08670 [Simiduia sp. 21SJ11W-1]|uniref:DUF7931 domain-containing protein n=1 Tax=Simiduia sp. 21SJ11W-1 TaxID=2909669 RepID=UPI00209CCDE0|nr:hypothetical protein [Simiduia sp. 21SJ11W-1]UTA49594.1 hypothetical protein L1F30_08670 [Simiduia sp. 21SJ11W-1]